MEMSQENSLGSYCKQTKMKFFFSFTKIGEQEGGTGSAWGIDTVAGP
jgi:hypothetical protein